MPYCFVHKQSYDYNETCFKCKEATTPSPGLGPMPKPSSSTHQLQTAQLEFVLPLNFPNDNGDYMPPKSLGLLPQPSSSLTQKNVSLTCIQETAATADRGSFIASGSYKQAYKLKNNGRNDVHGKVLIVTSKNNRKALENELKSLALLRAEGVRALRVFGQVDDLNDTEIGVLMENVDGKTEVKETAFGLSKTQKYFEDAANVFGASELVAQLQAVQDFMIKRNKGIGDLQFFIGGDIGCVLFDPLNLNADQINGGVQQMINFLKKKFDLKG